MSPLDALIAIPLWSVAGIFVAVMAARIIRDLTAPHDPEDYS